MMRLVMWNWDMKLEDHRDQVPFSGYQHEILLFMLIVIDAFADHLAEAVFVSFLCKVTL